MNKRKIVLIAADLLLILVLVIQLVSKTRDNVKIFEYKDTPDTVTITRGGSTLTIVNENGKWYAGDKKYPANENSVTDLLEAAAEVKALDKMGKISSENVVSKYELGDDSAITVVTSKEGKTLRTLKIGKDSSTGVQSYATIDNGSDVYLVSGNLKSTFDVTADSLRSKIVIDLDKDEITAANMRRADDEEWTLSRSGEGENLTWSISGAEIDVDSSKAASWMNSLAALSTPKWYDENVDLGGEFVSSVQIMCGNDKTTLDVYRIPADPDAEDSKDSYWGRCSTTPYTFEIASYSVEKFNKKIEDLAK